MKQLNILVVGAGIAGATAARLLTDAGHDVTVIDQAGHIAGNCYDYEHTLNGPEKKRVLVQKFGPHIFHTNSQKVFEFLSNFTEWEPYTHRVRANLGANCSIGMTINAKGLIRDLLDDFLDLGLPFDEAKNMLANLALELGSTDVSIKQLLAAKSVNAQLIGSVLWKKIYEPYTLYQWGTTDIDSSVFDRVRIRLDGDEDHTSYFKDKWQVMPSDGFTAMIQNILKGVDVHLGVGFKPHHIREFDRVFCTAPIDTVVSDAVTTWESGPAFGLPLPYRTMYAYIYECLAGGEALKFKTNATYNDASSYHSTPLPVLVNGQVKELKAPIRKTSFRKLSNEDVKKGEPDVYCFEYPMPWEEGLPRHYPIPTPEAKAMYEEYAHFASTLLPTVTFFGRLGSYQYLNMDQAVAQAMTVVKNFLEEEDNADF